MKRRTPRSTRTDTLFPYTALFRSTEVDGPDAWRSMVSKAFKEGASVIKIASNFAPDEVRAGIEEAHLLGLKVSCDCETIYTEVAVDAGVDMIEHPLPRLGAAITKMAKKKIGRAHV